MATMFSVQSDVQPERNFVCTNSIVYFKDVLFHIVMPYIKNVLLWAS